MTDTHPTQPAPVVKRYTAEPTNRDDSRWLIRYSPNPSGTKNADGSTTHSLSFPALELTEYVSSQEEAAKLIAVELNTYTELWEFARKIVDEFGGTIEEYDKNGPHFTHKDGTEVFDVGSILDRRELIEEGRALLSQTEKG